MVGLIISTTYCFICQKILLYAFSMNVKTFIITIPRQKIQFFSCFSFYAMIFLNDGSYHMNSNYGLWIINGQKNINTLMHNTNL